MYPPSSIIKARDFCHDIISMNRPFDEHDNVHEGPQQDNTFQNTSSIIYAPTLYIPIP